MPITVRSLIFILLIGFISFALASYLIGNNVSKKELNSWRNLWFLFQSLAFLSPNIWIFYGGVLAITTFFIPKEPYRRVSTYVFLLSSLPLLSVNLSGLGITNYLFTLNFARALAIFILLPTFFILLQKNTRQLYLFRLPVDKFVVLFLLFISLLDFRDDTFTNGLRFTFLHFIDYFLPYYVISRTVTNLERINKIIFAIILSISISAFIGLFEGIKHWHIYNQLVQHLLDTRLSANDVRGGILRAAATFMTPIALGYVITIAYGFYLYLSPLISNKSLRKIVPLGLIITLLTTVSRGPWVGFAFLSLIYISTGKHKVNHYLKLLFGSLASLPILLSTSFGQKFIDLLPFIGTIRADTVDYRDRLIEMSSIVIQQNPLFGSTTYLDTPEMQSMMQGEGIIDLVNSYIQIALAYGYIGLILFSCIFIVLLWQIYKSMKLLPKEQEDLFRLGRSLFSILFAVALIIYTVSSVDYIPYYYWILFGLSSSYIYICKQMIQK